MSVLHIRDPITNEFVPIAALQGELYDGSVTDEKLSTELKLKVNNVLNESSDILSDALNMGNGVYRCYALSGASYTGALPHGSYNYGTAIVLRKSENSLTVVVFSEASNDVPIINHYISSGWTGWKDFAGHSLATI